MADFEKLGAFYIGRGYDAAKDALADEPLMYDSRDLTTHAVCVGMTGSGKTGLCISILEEAALDGIPSLVIDPKGDIANLMLTFPGLTAAEFQPWIDPAEAGRKGTTPDALALRTAETWKNGLAEWGEDGDRIRRFRESVDIAIYTPGSTAGLPLSILRSFAPPPEGSDPVATRERISATVAGLLGLVGIAADPLKSREHILLSAIVDSAWSKGNTLDLAGLIGAIQKPPFEKVGVFDVETFYPASARLSLAMSVNNLLASPGFGVWLEGEALDIQRLLFTPEGKPRISIVSIAHLNDAERMFVVTLLANELVAWMRRQPGTAALRALFYMDEIFGYFPPTAMPPSKLPMLTLMKQARAFGLGVLLATQNPVDLDYKGLSNAGTWFIGRLQTERDQQRVIEGLMSAQAGAGFDRGALEKLMAGIAPRVFLMRNVNDDAPILFRTRWALSWLRGPLTLPEITRLMSSRKAAEPAIPAASLQQLQARRAPVLPAGVQEMFLAAKPGKGDLVYRAAHRRDGRAALRGQAGRRRQLDTEQLARTARRRQWFAGMGGGHCNSKSGRGDGPGPGGRRDVLGASRGRARREELRRLGQGARRFALPDWRSRTAHGQVPQADLECGRERGRFPRAPCPGAARAPRPGGCQVARKACDETQVTR